jgi:hypothetical protein
MKHFKFIFLIIISILLAFNTSNGANFNALFTPSTSALTYTNGEYGLYYSATNAGAQIKYLNYCLQNSTNISFQTSNPTNNGYLPINPCYLYGNYQLINTTNQSTYSQPFLFDTNNYPTPIQLAPPSINGVNPLN